MKTYLYHFPVVIVIGAFFAVFFATGSFAADVQIVTKNYVDSGLATKPSAGDVMDAITNAGAGYANASQGAKADTAVQPDDLDDYLPKSGGTMSGSISMSDNNITNLAVPVADADAATKGYIDTILGDIETVLISIQGGL